MDSSEMKSVLQNYRRFVEGYYKFYIRQGKVEFGYDMQYRMQNMHSKEFVKFGYQTRISPVLVSSEQLMQQFRIVARQQQRSEQESAVL